MQKEIIDTAAVLNDRFNLFTCNDEFHVTQESEDEEMIHEAHFATEREARINFLASIVQFAACFNEDEEITANEMLKQIAEDKRCQ
jgi:hypothetical protein